MWYVTWQILSNCHQLEMSPKLSSLQSIPAAVAVIRGEQGFLAGRRSIKQRADPAPLPMGGLPELLASALLLIYG